MPGGQVINYRSKLVILGLSAAIVLATGTAALASIPGPGGVISGCRQTTSGRLRVIDSQAGQTCRSSEEALNWNQSGPAGPPGPPGPQGPAGGSSNVYTASGGDAVNPANYTVITTLNLPPGKFLITGKGLALNQTGQTVMIACNMYQGNDYVDTSDATLPQGTPFGDIFSTATIPFLATAALAEAGHVRVECIEGQGPESAPFPRINVKLAAQEVGTLVPSP